MSAHDGSPLVLGQGSFGKVILYKPPKSIVAQVARKIFDNRPSQAKFADQEYSIVSLLRPDPSGDDVCHSVVKLLGNGRLPAGFYNFEEGSRFIDYEYLDGPTLADIIDSGDDGISQTINTPAKLAEIVKALVCAVHYTHKKKILHLDIKPANIIHTRAGRTVLIDFGISQTMYSKDLSEVRGTNGYQPPEWWNGSLPDEKYDIFSLGATFHRLLYGYSAVDTNDQLRRLEKAMKPQAKGAMARSSKQRNGTTIA